MNEEMQLSETVVADHKKIFGFQNFFRIIYRQLILAITKYPSLIIEVFLRRKFGERYYTLSASVIFSIILLIPYSYREELRYSSDIFYGLNITWVLFVVAFMGQSINRRFEFKRSSRIISGRRYSYCDGEKYPALWKWIEKKVKFIKHDDDFFIEKYYEPLLVFLVGLFLALTYIASFVGMFLMLIAILHHLRSSVRHAMGKDFIMNRIDGMIMSANLGTTLLENPPVMETDGFKIPGPRPSRDISEQIIQQAYAKDTAEKVTIE